MHPRYRFNALIRDDRYYDGMRTILTCLIEDISLHMVSDMESSSIFSQREMHELLHDWFNSIKRTGVASAEMHINFTYKGEQVSFDMERRSKLKENLNVYLRDYKNWLQKNRDYDSEEICDILRSESLLVDKLAVNPVIRSVREEAENLDG